MFLRCGRVLRQSSLHRDDLKQIDFRYKRAAKGGEGPRL